MTREMSGLRRVAYSGGKACRRLVGGSCLGPRLRGAGAGAIGLFLVSAAGPAARADGLSRLVARQITRPAADEHDRGPVVHPNGRTVYFVRGSLHGTPAWRVMVTDVQSLKVQPTPLAARYIVLSPSGDRLAYETEDQSRLGVFALASGKQRIVGTQVGSSGGWPAWNPDGHRLAYVRLPGNQVAILDLRTGSEVALADKLAALGTSWSPDGKLLAFWARRSVAQPDTVDLCVYRADGRRVVRRHVPGRVGFALSWSASGRQVYYVHQVTPTERAVVADDIRTGRRWRITGERIVQFPRVSRDGSWVAYRAGPPGSELRARRLSGIRAGGVEFAVAGSSRMLAAAWSPNPGVLIADGDGGLYAISVPARRARR